jgi:hypothetical protein
MLEHAVHILDERHVHKQEMVEAHLKSKKKSSGDKLFISREWDAATISCLAKGVNKYQSHRKRWDLVTDYMNHILSPTEPFTKPECIQQAQTIQSIQKLQHEHSASVKADARTPFSSSSRAAPSPGPSSRGADATTPPGVIPGTAPKVSESSIWSTEQQKQLGMYNSMD